MLTAVGCDANVCFEHRFFYVNDVRELLSDVQSRLLRSRC